MPDAASFHVPTEDQWSESGFGSYFHDTWTIRDIAHDEARDVVEAEYRIAIALATATDDVDLFDQVATAVEGSDLDHLRRLTEAHPELRPVAELADEPSPLLGLELGVAGLAHALAAVGAYPAASCRGHGQRGWAKHPVVYFAADRWRTEALAVLMATTHCGFSLDPERSELLTVQASSIDGTMALARRILDRALIFDPPVVTAPQGVQLNLPGT